MFTSPMKDYGSRPGTRGRLRTGVACEMCRIRKTKCNGEQPCTHCWQHGMTCVYREGPARASRRKNPVTPSHEVGRSMKVSKESKKTSTPPGFGYDPARIKKQMDLRAGIGVSNSRTGSFQFYGPSSHFNFIQRVYQRIYRTSHETPSDRQRHPIPAGLQRWCLEPFIFSLKLNANDPHISARETFINKERGDAFLDSYFRIIHPLMPILSRSDIIHNWEALWKGPVCQSDATSRDIVFMTLSLGARVSRPTLHESAEMLEKWAEYFSMQANNFAMTFQEPSFKVIQFLMLKSMDGLQAMRPNDSYLLLGHAARVSLAMGIDKSQVANGNSLNTHRLRVAFWIIYTNERMSALYTGRPSSLTDDHIDVPYPEDLPQLHHYGSILDANTHSPAKECAWIRSMSQIGRLAERVAKYVYSSGSARSIEDLFKVKLETMECDLILDGVVASLPPYLDFLDDTSPVGEEWQEIQRAHLALNYNMVRMIMHRPALVFAGFFASKEEAGEDASDIMTVRCSMVICVGAAKDIITTASDVMFNRFPDIRNDASVAAFLIAACVTLLYDVLAPDTNTDYGKIILGYVNRGIHCLDQMEHVGPTTGKALSIDIMKCAQDALKFSNEKTCRFGDMLHEFPWLRDAPEPPVVNSGQVPDTSFNQTYPFQYDPDLDYTFDWLDGSVLDLDVLKNL